MKNSIKEYEVVVTKTYKILVEISELFLFVWVLFI